MTQLPNPQEINDWSSFFKLQTDKVKPPLLKQFYAVGVVDENTPIKDLDFVALDFETTGLNADKDDIVSIGLVPFNLKSIYCAQSAHWIVRPKPPLNDESIVIHGITHSDISDAPDLLKILEDVLEHLHNKIVVVHYRPIERNFFDSALQRRIHEGILFPVIDTMQIEANLQHEQLGWFKRLLGTSIPSVRLANSRERYGLPPYSAHNALIDAIATAELFQAQVAHHFSPETPIGELWR